MCPDSSHTTPCKYMVVACWLSWNFYLLCQQVKKHSAPVSTKLTLSSSSGLLFFSPSVEATSFTICLSHWPVQQQMKLFSQSTYLLGCYHTCCLCNFLLPLLTKPFQHVFVTGAILLNKFARKENNRTVRSINRIPRQHLNTTKNTHLCTEIGNYTNTNNIYWIHWPSAVRLIFLTICND